MGCFCRGRIGIAGKSGLGVSKSEDGKEGVWEMLGLVGLVEYLTLPSFDVCALTAAKGVFSGSGASILTTGLAASAGS